MQTTTSRAMRCSTAATPVYVRRSAVVAPVRDVRAGGFPLAFAGALIQELAARGLLKPIQRTPPAQQREAGHDNNASLSQVVHPNLIAKHKRPVLAANKITLPPSIYAPINEGDQLLGAAIATKQ